MSGRNALASSSAPGRRRDADLVALEAQRALEHIGDVAVVFDDEHAGGAFEFGHLPAMLGQRGPSSADIYSRLKAREPTTGLLRAEGKRSGASNGPEMAASRKAPARRASARKRSAPRRRRRAGAALGARRFTSSSAIST